MKPSQGAYSKRQERRQSARPNREKRPRNGGPTINDPEQALGTSASAPPVGNLPRRLWSAYALVVDILGGGAKAENVAAMFVVLSEHQQRMQIKRERELRTQTENES
jgi:hypothetical protein